MIEFSKNALMEIGVKAWEGVRNMGPIIIGPTEFGADFEPNWGRAEKCKEMKDYFKDKGMRA